MVDREKVIMMTKAAMEEKKNGRKRRPADRYFAYDYISMQVIKGVIGVSILYVLIVACLGLLTADTWMTGSTLPKLFDLGIRLGVLYLCILVAVIVILILVYALRYTRAQRMVADQKYNLRQICHSYEEKEKKRGE